MWKAKDFFIIFTVLGRENLYSCLNAEITLKRRVGNQLLNTYLPTTCILLIVCMTNYFKIEHYDTRIMVALTGNMLVLKTLLNCFKTSKHVHVLVLGMLVIASLLVSTSASLPKTSYMKMIDLWMIFCFLVPFLVVILHTIIEFLGEYTHEG